MSNIQRMENVQQIVLMAQPQFDELARIHNAVNFKREASFALQALTDSAYLAQVAMGNPDSLKRAIINVAAIGLTLSPVQKLAYLVPRDGKVCLDISYQGYIQLATDSGAIMWAVAEIVRKNDQYEFLGVGKEPAHKFKPFADDRGPIVGAYCVAKTHDGEFIVTQMSIEEIYSIRNRSQSWRAFVEKKKSTPWNTDETEMIKKTVLKRGYKSWPKTDSRHRLDSAIDVMNEADPIDLSPAPTPLVSSQRDGSIARIRKSLETIDRTEERYLGHLERVFSRDIKSLDDLTEIELDQANIMLDQFVENKRAKEASNENP